MHHRTLPPPSQVERLVSFLNYRLAEASPRSDWLSAGLPFGGNTTIAAVIDAASDNSLRDLGSSGE